MVTTKKNSPRLRDNIETVAVFYACRAGYYDTRLNLASSEPRPRITFRRMHLFLPPGATHRFAIQVEHNRYVVTRYEDNWVVDFADKTEAQKRERVLRKGALYKALRHFAEELSYPLEDGGEDDFIKHLLSDKDHPEGALYADGMTGITGHHPIVRDEPSGETSSGGEMHRWSVTILSRRCLVGLVNDAPTPEFALLL